MVDRIDRLGDAVDIARRSVTIARQSAVVGNGASLIAMVAAALGYLPPAAGAVLQEVIDVAVILNALRAMRPARGAGLEIDEAHTALSNQFQEVHDALRPKIDRLAMVADEIGVVAPDLALQHAREVQEFLTTELLPHEQSEDRTLYPSLARVLGGEDPTGVMSRGHAEIVHLIGRIGRILDDIDGTELMGQDAVEVRRLLYGLQAVLRLHFAQESEGFFSLVAANT
jgi:iron-sulfur cluster repair protein YtfE (RIC family)